MKKLISSLSLYSFYYIRGVFDSRSLRKTKRDRDRKKNRAAQRQNSRPKNRNVKFWNLKQIINKIKICNFSTLQQKQKRQLLKTYNLHEKLIFRKEIYV
jgi:hypothetical protein